MSESRFPSSPRSKPRQHPERGTFDRETVYSILDEGLIAHVGIVVGGQPFVLPMGYGRRGDSLFLHGSRISRRLGDLADGAVIGPAGRAQGKVDDQIEVSPDSKSSAKSAGASAPSSKAPMSQPSPVSAIVGSSTGRARVDGFRHPR